MTAFITRSLRVLVLAGLLGASAWRPAAAGGQLDIASPGNPASLDPHKITGVWENRIVGDMFVGLTTEGPDGSVTPGAARRWTVSDDGLTYTFTLRDAVWSDGQPVTAQDFEYSFKRMLAPETAAPYADFFFVITGAKSYATGGGAADDVGVEAVDAHTLRIVLNRPTAYFPGLLMHFAAMPVPRRTVERYGRDWTQPGHIVVNGPFIVRERVPNAYVALERNPRFYGADSVELDRVVYHVQEDRAAAVQRFRTGEFDIVRDFPSSKAGFLRDTVGKDVVRTEPFLGLTFIAVNQRRPALADRRVRTALSLSLDRRVIARRVLGSGEQPAYSLVPPGTGHYGAPARYRFAQWPRERRLSEARRLLDAAGYGQERPLALKLRYRISDNDRRVAIAAQAMWKRVGIDVTLISAETAIHYARLEHGQFDLGIASWLAVYSDPQTFTLLLQSKTGANNFGVYSNPEYDRLTALAGGTPDVDARAEYLHEAERLALDDQGLLPIYHHASRNLVSPAVTGWRDNVLDVHRSRYLGTMPASSAEAGSG
jgi:oligopeptide transport system substrate-binding protein